jgi:hypothetical protein
MRAVSSGMTGIGSGCMDRGFLLRFSLLSFFFSISYFSSVPQGEFANNITKGLYPCCEGRFVQSIIDHIRTSNKKRQMNHRMLVFTSYTV